MISHSKPYIDENDMAAVASQLLSNNIAHGAKVAEFENAVKEYLGLSKSKLVDSGSKALKIVLQALEIGRGDEVILPTYVCHNVIDAIISLNASPVLCDIGQDWNMTVETIEKVISPNTKAIIIVHTMGISMEVKPVKKFGIPVIEDCCQSFGSKFMDGTYTGKAGDIAIYSFQAIKCLTTGEGGLIATDNDELFQRVNSICRNKSDAGVVSDIQAALGLSQLKKYPMMLEKRKKIAEYYFDNILNKKVVKKFLRQKTKSFFYRFLIESDADFDTVKNYFADNGIAVRKGVDELLHKSYPQYSLSLYPAAEKTFNRTISLPIYPSLSMAEVKKIVTTLNNYEAI